MPPRSLIAAALGVLDILLFSWNALPAWEHAFRYLREPAPWPGFVLGIEVLRLVAVASLLASGAVLLPLRRGRRRWPAVTITVLQLPLRVAFGLFTFGFLRALGPYLPPRLEAQYALILALIILEVARAALTPFLLRPRSRARPDPAAPRGGAGS